jgi:tetratricopeptide (TPR) repeat protein
VRFTDYAIERLVDGVAEREGGGLLTVLTADHGEALGEHDEKRHGYFVYDSTMKVPLVFHWPGRIPAAESRAAARLVDVAPTILALVGVPALADVDGISLVPLFKGEDLELPPAYLETRLPWIFYGWSPLAAIRTADWKLIDAPRPELYHLAEDPGEKHDLLASRPQRAAELRALLEGTEAVPGRASQSVVDDEALARLRALGYVGAGGSPDAVPAALADPKDRIDLRNRLQEAERAAGAGRFSEAVRRFDEVLEIEPDNRCAVLRSGVALLKAGRPEAAVPRLQRATELDPDRAEAQYALADALMRIDAPARAVAHWQELTRLQPRRAEAWFNLGAASAAAGELDRAVAAHRKAGDLDPGNAAFLRGLALAEAAAGESSAAAAHFETLVGMVGVAGFADAASYGLVLAELERTPEAVEWLGRSRPEEPDHAEARIRLARIELEAGNVEAARSALAEALAADPGSIRLIDGDAELSSLLD